jgi:hypothetical protein
MIRPNTSQAVGLQRKMVAHEFQGVRWMSWACEELYRDWLAVVGPPDATAPKRRPTPVCTVLACIIDYSGFRVLVSTVPPVDELRTLVYGRMAPLEPFVKHSSQVFSMLKRVGRHLNLKPHQAEVLCYHSGDGSPDHHGSASEGPFGDFDYTNAAVALQTINICLPVSVQGHQCDDHRFYITELSRLFPADSPALRSADTLIRVLRPEIVVSHRVPLSPDAFCDTDLGR